MVITSQTISTMKKLISSGNAEACWKLQPDMANDHVDVFDPLFTDFNQSPTATGLSSLAWITRGSLVDLIRLGIDLMITVPSRQAYPPSVSLVRGCPRNSTGAKMRF